jgi:pyruvate/2-oxoglutarate dehydrogenase complex dihydrolipoamide acyltransferase (E2) component
LSFDRLEGRCSRDMLKMQKVGDAIDESVVIDALAKGEWIAVGQSLLLVKTDKAKSEIPYGFVGKVIEIFIFVSKEMATGTQMLAIEA